MEKTKIAVLGANGMLGSMVYDVLSQCETFEVLPITRPLLDAALATSDDIYKAIKGATWVVNCIGVIRPKCQHQEEYAIRVNALFPHQLAKMAQEYDVNVVQIATDCADDPDTYGMTKKLGEVHVPHFANIRCSIIGPGGKEGLLDWFLAQEDEVNGYTHHFWNGVTTLAFAKMCRGLILEDHDDVSQYDRYNFVPADKVSKYELLELLKLHYEKDIEINVVSDPDVVNKLLIIQPGTEDIWNLAGYYGVPTINDLIKELREYHG